MSKIYVHRYTLIPKNPRDKQGIISMVLEVMTEDEKMEPIQLNIDKKLMRFLNQTMIVNHELMLSGDRVK